ncbi:MAG TPA: alpha/beta hydrolase [Fimbriiglobus sp.]|nr:alpha/beta hydrolase [Fimbriiglobus sp.]
MAPWNGLIERLRPKAYGRRPPLVLINGLAEQHESWFRNKRFWGRHFDLYAPNILVYDGLALQRMVEARQPITVEYLVGELFTFLDRFVQNPPYHLVSSSLGGKVAVEFAVRHPELVNRVVLICPSGMGDQEQLPIMEGVMRNDMYSVVRSVFHKTRFVDRDLVKYYKLALNSRKWKTGLLRTVRGTLEFTVRPRMRELKAPTLLITGERDRICDPTTAAEAARELPHGHFLAIPNCGHAPQIERHWLINRVVAHFLKSTRPSAHPRWTQLLKPGR